MLQKLITVEEYVKALSEDSVMPKTKLEKILKDRQENNRRMLEMEKQANQINGAMRQVMEMQAENSNEVEGIAQQAEMINTNAMNNEMSSM